MRLLALLWLLVLVVPAFADDQMHFSIHGQDVGCKDIEGLNKAIVLYDNSYYSEWSQQDFREAIKWSKACPASDMEIGEHADLAPDRRVGILMAMRPDSGNYPKIVVVQRNDTATFSIHGETQKCDDITELDRSLALGDPGNFAGWSPNDFRQADAMAHICIAHHQFDATMRLIQLHKVENNMLVPEDAPSMEAMPGKQAFGYDLGGAMITIAGLERRFEINCAWSLAYTAPTATVGDETSDTYKGMTQASLTPDVVAFYEKNADNCVANGVMSPDQAATFKKEIEKTVAEFADFQTKKAAEDARIAAATAAAEQAAEDAARQKRVDAVLSEMKAREVEKAEADRQQAWQKKQQDCENSPHALAYSAQESIISDLEAIRDANKKIAYQHQIGEVSGYVDKADLYASGESIVDSRSDLQSAWKSYRKFGGSASTPQKVTHKLQDPCTAFASGTPPPDFKP